MPVVNFSDIADHVIDYALDVPEQAQDWFARKGLEHILEYSAVIPASLGMVSRSEPVMLGMLLPKTKGYVRGMWFDAQKAAALSSTASEALYLLMPSDEIDKDLETIRDLMISGNPDAVMLEQLNELSFNALLGREDKKMPEPAYAWPADCVEY